MKEEEEPKQEQVEIPVEDEESPTAPQECDLPGAGSSEEEVQPEGYERHRAVNPRNYTALLHSDPASFNRALKICFAFTVGAVLLSIISLVICSSGRNPVVLSTSSYIFNHTWLLGFIPFGKNNIYLLALFAAVVGFGLDVERPGFKLRPVPKWMVRSTS